MLGLTDLLEPQARELSGGERQRVAMGRAIVRAPAAFLMDEPLSNLDAKLRVQMRAEIAALQTRLGVTTVYVTHDQVEAMTMGHRVAVIRDGRLQQCDTPPTPSPSPSSCPGLVSNGQLSQPAGQRVGSPHRPSRSELLWSRGQGSHTSPTASLSASAWSGLESAGQLSQASPNPSPSPSS